MIIMKAENSLKSSRSLLADNKGSILVIALLSLCMLSIFSVQLGYVVRQKLTLVKRLDTKDKLHLIAEAGIKKVIAELKREDITHESFALKEAWGRDIFTDVQAGDGQFTVCNYYFWQTEGAGGERTQITKYGIMDEERKINVNKAGIKVLRRLFQNVANLDERSAAELAYCIIDWKDPDSYYQHPQYGAEDADYERLRSPYEAKDAEFEVLDELLLVKGMNQEVFDKVKDYLTIYGEGKININTVSKEVMLALGLKEEIADKILLFPYGGDSIMGTADDNIFSKVSSIVPELSQFTPLSASEVALLSNLISTGVFTTNSDYFMIRSVAGLNGRNIVCQIVSVVNNDGTIVFWREQ